MLIFFYKKYRAIFFFMVFKKVKGENMKIASISPNIPKHNIKNVHNKNIRQSSPQNNVNKNTNYKQSFKAIYIDEYTDIGDVSVHDVPPVFYYEDALLINEIVALFPNQDCFIGRGYENFPVLKFREKPYDIQYYTNDEKENKYHITIDPKDSTFGEEPLILYPQDNKYKERSKCEKLNMHIGLPSSHKMNPSLFYTLYSGYELHKKLLFKRDQILEIVGTNKSVDFGGKNVLEKAHDEIDDAEMALVRYLCDFAYVSENPEISEGMIRHSDYSKRESYLNAKLQIDLKTSIGTRPKPPSKSEDKDNLMDLKDTDLCETVIRGFPEEALNQKRLDEITRTWENESSS